ALPADRSRPDCRPPGKRRARARESRPPQESSSRGRRDVARFPRLDSLRLQAAALRARAARARSRPARACRHSGRLRAPAAGRGTRRGSARGAKPAPRHGAAAAGASREAAPPRREARSRPRRESFLQQLLGAQPLGFRKLAIHRALAADAPNQNTNSGNQKNKWTEPEEKRARLERRAVEHEVAVARHHEVDHLALACTARELRADLVAQVHGQAGVRLRERLVLAY